MAEWKLYALGQPVLKVDDKPVKFEIRKSLGLLIFLRSSRQEHSREYLSSLFWPEHDQAHALANLRRALYSLNKIIGHNLVLADREKICCSTPSNIWFDVEELEKFLTKIENVNSEIDDQFLMERENLNCVIGLYRGNFLEGFDLRGSNEFDNWQTFNRENINIRYANLLKKYAQWSFSQSDWEQVIKISLKWIDVDSYNESAMRLLMRSYANSGLIENSLRVCENFEKAIRTELGKDLESETIELINQIRSGKNTQLDGQIKESKFITSLNESKYAILKTKLFIPRLNQSAIIRHQLIEKIHEGVKSPIVLLSAPAGYGKTTLLVEWATSSHLPVGWYSLDITDNDPNQFLAYLISTVAEIHDAVGQNCLRILQDSRSVSAQSILNLFLKDLESIHENMVIILDDYHNITSQDVHELLLYLIEHQPTFLHIIIATRADPPLRLSRLRTSDQIVEIRANDLRFDSSEIDEFLNHNLDLDIGSNQLSILENRTEGWIVGLQMAAFAISAKADKKDEFIRSFSGSHRLILDYLADEVINHLPGAIQDFLIKTSILNRLNGPLCNKVTNSENCQEILEELERNNMFLISIDDEKNWFRYHHLFGDLLQNRLRKRLPLLVKDLHLRASHWYRDNAFQDEAIYHALQGCAYNEVADLIESESKSEKIVTEASYKLQNWLSTIPIECFENHPWMTVLKSWMTFREGESGKVEEFLRIAERDVRKKTFQGIEKKDLSGYIAMLRAYVNFNRCHFELAIQQAMTALEQAREENVILRGYLNLLLGELFISMGELNKCEPFLIEAIDLFHESKDHELLTIAYFRRAHVLKLKGKLNAAISILNENINTLQKMRVNNTGVTWWPEICLGDIYREQNNLEKAIDITLQGMNHSQEFSEPNDKVYAHTFLAQVYSATGEFDEALKELSEAESLINTYTIFPGIRCEFEAVRANIWIRSGQLSKVEAWLEEKSVDQELEINFQNESCLIAFSRFLIYQKKYGEAEQLLSHLSELATEGGRFGRLIEILALQAINFFSLGKKQDALHKIKDSLLLGEPEGFNRIFVDEGPLMEEFLREVRADDENIKRYVNNLIDTFYEKETKYSFSSQPLIDLLSDREIEVLHLMAAGLSNPEIASRLYLSIHTVKVHSRNIYSKLGVHNRTQAVVLARELEILPSN